MNRTFLLFLVAALCAVALGACGPKPAPGQVDRDRADDALGRLK